MDFRLLGRLEVSTAGAPVRLDGNRQRALLAILLLHAGEVVSTDRLIDDLYGVEPPKTAAKSLQAHVSRLRKALRAEERLRRQGPGYVLEVAEGELDVDRFSALLVDGRSALAAGRPHHAVERFEEAFALWRGPPLADVAYADFAQSEIARLEELRLNGLEDLVEARLVLGAHADVVSTLRRLVAEHPLRERLRAQLLLALYRSGRQAEALEAYQHARSALVEGLGIEPSRALRELHQAILNQDPALAAPPRVTQADQDLGPAPAVNVASTPALRGETRKTVTAVMIKLAVATNRGDILDPEALRRVLRRAFAEVEAATARHGGTVDPPAGDTITAVFGLPMVNEDDAVRAVRAASEARTAVSQLGAALAADQELRLGVHVGIGSGEVVAGGEPDGLVRATGAPFARAAALADQAASGEVLVDDATLTLVRAAAVVERVNGAARVIRVEEPGQAHVARLASPMVGRERERRRLHDAFDQAVSDRSSQLFTVLGPAGVGKSRLVHEFITDVRNRASVVRGRCLPYGKGITYWPLLEAIREAVGLEDAEPPDDARAKLAAALADEAEADALALRLAEIVGLAEAGGGAEDGVRAVQTLFASLARRQPLVVVFDDIHWGEPTFLDLVEHLAEWGWEAPLLLVCLARPELLDVRAGWGGGKLNATTVLLEPLSGEQCRCLIQNLVGETELAAEVAATIGETAEGNPLFVEEMLSMLMDDGLLVRDAGRWVATAEIGTVRVPPTIHALLEARLDRLHPTERAVIECAAVVGKVFYEGALRELAPAVVRPALAETLAALVRKDLIRAQRPSLGGRTYAFRHLLIRDAAYDSIPKEARAELHETFGRWLERAAGDRAVEYEEVVGYHLEQAFAYRAELGAVGERGQQLGREAAERLAAAARRAFERSDAPAGLNLASRAAALLPAADPLRVNLVPNMRVVQGARDLDWAERVLTEAVEAAATAGDRRLAATALVQRGFLRLFSDPDVSPAELVDAAQRAIAAFDDVDDQLGLARAWRLVAQAHYLDRRLASCAEASERALTHVRLAGDRIEEREIVEWLVIALQLGPAPADGAVRRCERLLEETADELLLADILGAMAYLETLLERAREADKLMGRARTILQNAREPMWVVLLWFGWVHIARGDADAAEDELRIGYDALKRLGEKTHFSSFAQGLADVAYTRQRYDDAHRLTRECEAASRPNDIRSQVLWRSTRAKAFARMGQLEAAEQLAREAVAFAAGGDFHSTHADALTDLAEVLELRGERAAAAKAAEEAVRLYELKGNRLHRKRARSRLNELSR